MKGENLFHAVGQVGDDLIARAEKTPARQASRWKPLAALAACCVLIVGIAALTLPNWLGSNKTASSDTAPAAAAEIAEDSADARAYSGDTLVGAAAPEAEFEEYAAAQEAPTADAAAEEAPAAGEAPVTEAPAEDAPAEAPRDSSAKTQAAEAGAPDGDWIVFGGQYYTPAPANDPAHTAGEAGDGEARGAQLGTVEDSSDGALTGCAVYAYPDEDCVLVECEGEFVLYRVAE